MYFEMNCPTPIVFGAGKFDELHKQKLPGKKALIIISEDKIAVNLGFLKRLTDQLDEMKISYCVFDDVQANPVISNVMESSALARTESCDFIIGLGGGSVLDTCKAASLMATNDGYYWDYVDGTRRITNPRLPVVTITTTAGTGTEIAPFFVITNEEKNEKVGFPSPRQFNTWPVLAIVDPELTVSVPPNFTAYQGFDAFAHCVESYLSNKANQMSDMYSLAAVEAVSQNLKKAVENGTDLHARSRLSFASLCSGVVMAVGSSTSKHSLEHAMSAYHNELPHGAGLLMICRAYYEMLISKHVVDDRFVHLAQSMGVEYADKPEDFIAALNKLMYDCGVGELKMSDYGISRDEFKKFVHNARSTAIGYLFGADSAILTDEDCLEVYEKSYR